MSSFITNLKEENHNTSNMERFILPMVLFSGFTILLPAQNLVPDPSFEAHFENSVRHNESIFWFRVGNTSDFFHRSYPSQAGISIPSNVRGYQEPASGDGYAGIITWGGPKEYLGVRLKETLMKDTLYDVSFKVCLSDITEYATDDIGVFFTENDPQEIEDFQENAFFHVKQTEGVYITDTVNWTTISGKYLANGTENYLVIGDFHPKENLTDIIVHNEDGIPWNYFFVDDVVVENCFQQTEEDIIFYPDTTICEGQSIRLAGIPDAESHFWPEAQSAEPTVEITTTGIYLVENYFECHRTSQVYEVNVVTCECDIHVPTIQSAGELLQYTFDDNVTALTMNIFAANGQHINQHAFPGAQTPLTPNTAGMFFWTATLNCLDGNGILFKQNKAGKLIVIE